MELMMVVLEMVYSDNDAAADDDVDGMDFDVANDDDDVT